MPAPSIDAEPLTIREQRGGGTVTLYLRGELDLAGAELLHARLRALQSSYRGRLVIDLRGLEFLGSAGIAALVSAEAYARRDGWILELRPGNPQVQRVFAVCGLLNELPFAAAI